MRNKIQPAIIKRKPPSSTARRAGWIGCNFNLSRIPAEAYAFTRELEKLHPDNRHVRDKIRQQLQVLRDRSARQGGFWYQLKSQKARLGQSIGAIARLMFVASLSFFPCLIFKCFTPI
jgi:Dam-replacing HTH domain/Dam-replacing family